MTKNVCYLLAVVGLVTLPVDLDEKFIRQAITFPLFIERCFA